MLPVAAPNLAWPPWLLWPPAAACWARAPRCSTPAACETRTPSASLRRAADMRFSAGAGMAGSPAEKQAGLVAADPAALRTRPPRRLASHRVTLGPQHFARLATAAEFSRAVTKPSGRVAQIGDNDSGRFLKLHPIFALRGAAEARLFYANLEDYDGLTENAPYLDEETLDHPPTIAGIAALVGRRDLAADAGGPRPAPPIRAPPGAGPPRPAPPALAHRGPARPP